MLHGNSALFAEDFDLLAHDHADAGSDVEVFDEPADPVAAAPAADASAEAIEQLRAEAYADGFRCGLAHTAQERAAAAGQLLAQIAERMTGVDAAMRAATEDQAGAVARLLLGTLGTLFPQLSARHGGAEVAALARAILPGLADQVRVTVRVNPHCVAELQAELDRLDPECLENLRLLPTDAMAPGDARITWQDGSAIRDGGALWKRVAEVLATQGLIDPPR